MTFNQLTYDILNIARGGIQTDEDPISMRQIGFWILNTRAELLRQQANKGRNLSDNYVQSLSCAEVELVDLSACCNIKTDCVAYRTKLEIPKPIEANYEDLITRVGPVDFTKKPFHFIPVSRVVWEIDNKWGMNVPKAFLYGQFIYVVGKNLVGLKFINVDGVFEDPFDVGRFKNCDGEACFSNDSEFPISRWMVETMKKMVLNPNLQMMLGLRTDTENDSRVPNEIKTDNSK